MPRPRFRMKSGASGRAVNFNHTAILFDAVCGFYHCIIILDLEGVILERMQFR